MAILTGLTIYPIKSCGGVELTEATLTPAGLRSGDIHDRQWMLVDMDGEFLTQRELPIMALVQPRFTAAGLSLHFPGKPMLGLTSAAGALQRQTLQVRVWDDALQAIDAGPAAAAWFSDALGTPCRLVEFAPESTRTASRKWTEGLEVPTLFSDGFPMLLIGQQSLSDLNAKLVAAGREPLPMDRFRPNLVIDEIEAFEEDYLASLQLGAAMLKPVKPCPRCPIPSIDQQTGAYGPDPLDILRAYRCNPRVNGAVSFGMNVILAQGEGQTVQLGQQIETELSF